MRRNRQRRYYLLRKNSNPEHYTRLESYTLQSNDYIYLGIISDGSNVPDSETNSGDSIFRGSIGIYIDKSVTSGTSGKVIMTNNETIFSMYSGVKKSTLDQSSHSWSSIGGTSTTSSSVPSCTLISFRQIYCATSGVNHNNACWYAFYGVSTTNKLRFYSGTNNNNQPWDFINKPVIIGSIEGDNTWEVPILSISFSGVRDGKTLTGASTNAAGTPAISLYPYLDNYEQEVVFASEDFEYIFPVSKCYRKTPVTIEMLEAGAITWKMTHSSAEAITLQYKINNGTEQSITSAYNSPSSINVNAGDKVTFYKSSGNNIYPGWNRSLTVATPNSFYVSGRFKVYGNIFSLSNANYATTKNTIDATNGARFAFADLFENNDKLVSAKGLFLGTTSTTLQTACYDNLFSHCTSLKDMPHIFMQTAAEYCYYGMFGYCSSLYKTVIDIPSIPAATSHSVMFRDCTSLIIPPALPQTTLQSNCYNGMFANCSSLLKAPDLFAPTLVAGCYREMFMECSSLEAIKCMATAGYDTSNCTYRWVLGVADFGIFTEHINADFWEINSINGIPHGWRTLAIASDGSQHTTQITYDDNGDPVEAVNTVVDSSGNVNTQTIEYDENGDPEVVSYTINTEGNESGTGELIVDAIDTGFVTFNGKSFTMTADIEFSCQEQGTSKYKSICAAIEPTGQGNKYRGFYIRNTSTYQIGMYGSNEGLNMNSNGTGGYTIGNQIQILKARQRYQLTMNYTPGTTTGTVYFSITPTGSSNGTVINNNAGVISTTSASLPPTMDNATLIIGGNGINTAHNAVNLVVYSFSAVKTN